MVRQNSAIPNLGKMPEVSGPATVTQVENGESNQKSFKTLKKLDGGCIPSRHVISILGFVCVLLMYALKVNLSVAIVAMVKQKGGSRGNISMSGSCPSLSNTEDVEVAREIIPELGEFDWDESTQGIILSAFYYGYVATQLLGGIAAVRWGGKVVVGPAMALTGVFSMLSPIAARSGGVGPFIAARILQGASSGVVFPALLSLFSLWFPPCERTQFAGFTFASIHLGTVIGMTLSGYLVAWSGWPLVFYFFGAVGVLFLVPWWIFVYDRPEDHPRISEEEARFLQESLETTSNETDEPLKVPWREIFTSPAVWSIVLVHFGYSWVLFTFVSGLPTYMKNILNYDIQKSAFLASVPYLLQWVTSMASGVISQWIRRREFLSHINTYRIMNGIFLMGSAVSMLAITFLGCSYMPIIAMFSLYGILGGMFYGGSYLNHMDIAVNFAGILSGINQTLAAAAGVVAPIVMGQLTQGKQTLGQWNIVFYIGVGISVGCFVFFMIFGSVEEEPWNKPPEKERPAEESASCRF